MDFEFMIKELIIALLPHTELAAKELETKIATIISGYSITKMNETLPSTGDGSTTKYLVQEYMKDKLVQGLSMRTLEQYLMAVQKLFDYTHKEVTLMTKEDIINYLNYYSYSNPNGEQKPNTVKNRYLQLSAFFTWLRNNKYIVDNPFDSINTPKGNIPTKEVITTGEMERIIIACEKHQNGIKLARDLAITTFLLESGVRVTELSNIKLRDVDWDKKRVIIHQGKGDKSRAVFFGEKAKERLEQYLSYRDYTDNDYLFSKYYHKGKLNKTGIENIIKKIGEYADIPRLHPHLFRTTFATNLIRKGISVSVVKALMGHANLNTLESYVQLTETDIVHSLQVVY